MRWDVVVDTICGGVVHGVVILELRKLWRKIVEACNIITATSIFF